MNEMKSYSQAVTGVSFLNPLNLLGIVVFFSFKFVLYHLCFKATKCLTGTSLKSVNVCLSSPGFLCHITAMASPQGCCFSAFRGVLAFLIPDYQAYFLLPHHADPWRTSPNLIIWDLKAVKF